MKKEKEEIVLSEFERKEIFRNRVYKVLPVIAIILLILLWVAASSNPMSKFPSPGAVWEKSWLTRSYLGELKTSVYRSWVRMVDWYFVWYFDWME